MLTHIHTLYAPFNSTTPKQVLALQGQLSQGLDAFAPLDFAEAPDETETVALFE